MKKTQFESYTTNQDKEDFERLSGFKPKDKLDFAYCFLMTIAHKSIQEEHNNFDFLIQPSNKVVANAVSELTKTNRIIPRILEMRGMIF